MWLDSLTPEGELLTQQQKLGSTAETPELGFLTGIGGQISAAIEFQAIETGAWINSGLSSAWQFALELPSELLLPPPREGAKPAGRGGLSRLWDYANPYATVEDNGRADVSAAERSEQRTMGEGTAYAYKSLSPDPRTTGLAGQILFEVARYGPRTALGYRIAGWQGGALLAGGPAGYTSKHVAMLDGIDEATATLKGTIDGVTMGVGAAIPAARFVKPVAGDFFVAVGANVGLGVASRGATSELLENAGYTAQAAQYRAFDTSAMAIDGVLGAAFFGLGRAMSARPSEAQVAAALTENNAQHAQLHTAPGIPVDALAANTHVRALDISLEQLARGEKVRLPDDLPEAAFLRRPDEPSPLTVEVEQQQARFDADEFAARVGRANDYDETGAPTFADGTAYPLRDMVKFFDQFVAITKPKDGAHMPNVLFQIGEVSDQVAQGLRRYLPGFHDGLREARISGQSVKHIMDSRPSIVRDVLAGLERGVLIADEVLPNRQKPDRALLVVRDERDVAARHKRNGATVLEVSANGKGIDVVSAMTMPEQTLKKARAYRDEVEASRTGGLPPPSSLATEQARQPHAAAASEDFPTVAREADSSIRPSITDATDPEVKLAQALLDDMGDLQVPTGAIDAEGRPVTVSIRDMLSDIADEDVRVEAEKRGLEAAALCSLQRGE